MTIKRWIGKASSSWDTATGSWNATPASCTCNWVNSDNTAKAANPIGAGNAGMTLDVPGTTRLNATTVRITTNAPHGIASTDVIRLSGFAGNGWEALNWDNPNTGGTGRSFSVTVVGANQLNIDTTSINSLLTSDTPVTVGTYQFMGDDVRMLSGDKPTGGNYCATGPASTITINSLTITLAASTNAVGILSANGAKVTVASTFSFTDAAGTPNGANVIGGTTETSSPVLASGCVGSIIAQPNHNFSATGRSFNIDTQTGSMLTIKALPADIAGFYAGSQWVLLGGSTTPGSDGPTTAGTVIIDPASEKCVMINGTLNGGRVDFNQPCVFSHGIFATGTGGTLNVNAPSQFSPQGLSAWNSEGLVMNIAAGASAFIYDIGSDTQVGANMTINASGPVAFSNFGVKTGKTLTINSYGAPVIKGVPSANSDATGSIVVSGATLNSINRRR